MPLHSIMLALMLQAPTDAPAAKVAKCRSQYAGTLTLQPNDDGRTMVLTKPYAFVDDDCQSWAVPAGSTVDGASIPRVAWSIIGPWEGKYRNASVIHDYFCDRRIRSWRSVHLMFYQGMLASGVDPTLAKMMYAAVYYGGPRWSDATVRNNLLAGGPMQKITSDFRDMLVQTIQANRHLMEAHAVRATAGAKGLMQLMPAVVSERVKNLGIQQSSNASAVPITLDDEVLVAVVDQAGRADSTLSKIEQIADSAREEVSSGNLQKALIGGERQRTRYICLVEAYKSGELPIGADENSSDAIKKCGK